MPKYWEVEKPTIKESSKNVVKVYRNQGKVQVFPIVEKSKHGIGRGVTIDLEVFHISDLLHLKNLINEAIDNQINKIR
ncbi:hypothetical protein [Niallia circulans]|uniref:hypothetical protein n=1 Tax=Niallia circulans TaxID=1397 RepID=UPI0030092663